MYGDTGGTGYTKITCAIKVFDILASLYVNANQLDYDHIYNGKADGTGSFDDTIIGCCFVEQADLEQVVADICYIYRLERDFSADGLHIYRNVGLNEGAEPLVKIPAEELAVSDNTGNNVRFEVSTTYLGQSNLPTKLTFNFLDADNDYKGNQMTAKRPEAQQGDSERSISLPFVMTVKDADTLVNRLMGDATLKQIQHAFRLPPKYAYIGKGDVIEIDHGSFGDTVRIVDVDFNADMSQSVTAETVAAKTIPQEVVDHAPTNKTIGGAVVASEGYPLDIPLTDPEEIGAAGVFELYETCYPISKGSWKGGYFAQKLDGGSYETVFEVRGNVNKSGEVILRARATNKLSDKRWVTDSDTLTLGNLNVDWNEAYNVTRDVLDLNPRRNMAVYGAPGRWEIIQFMGIKAGKMYGIVRGLRGTEVFAGMHEEGDTILTLFPSVALILVGQDKIGTKVVYRAVSSGRSFLSATEYTSEPLSGNSRRPFAPYRFKGVRAASGDITFSWVRRDKLGFGWGKPLVNSEPNLKFTVIVATSNGANIRTLAATDTSVVYSAQQQSDDGTVGTTKFLLLVVQIGAQMSGFAGKELVNV